MKTLKINDETHKELSTLKINGGHKTLDETIANMIRWYEWWIKPGKYRGHQSMTIEEYREMMRTGKLPDDK